MDLFPDIGLEVSKFQRQCMSVSFLPFFLLLLYISNQYIINYSLPSFCLFFVDVWGDLGNQRKFFENYAETKGFDPLVPENWYLQSTEGISDVKVYCCLLLLLCFFCLFVCRFDMMLMVLQGANKIISFYNRSIAKALLTIFPDIGLLPAKLHMRCIPLPPFTVLLTPFSLYYFCYYNFFRLY